MKISREIKTAILVLSAIVLFIWGYSFLKGKSLFDNSKKFYVVYENVEGLTTSSNVTINGLIVGKVSKIDIEKNTGKLVVELQMTHPFEVSKTSVAYIYSPGFIGGRDIAIEPNFTDENIAQSGDFLNTEVKKGITDKLSEQLDPIQKKLDEVLANANTMILSINSVLDVQAQSDLKNTLAQLNAAMTQVNGILATNKPKIDGALTNIDQASANFSKLSSSLNSLDINGTFAKLESASSNIDAIMAGIEKGEGSVGKLLKDDQLYTNLTQASKELEQLMQDLKLNPKRYVHFSLFGKKATPYQVSSEIDTASTAATKQ